MGGVFFYVAPGNVTSGEGIVLYAVPKPFLLNKICLNQISHRSELGEIKNWCKEGIAHT